MSCARSTSSRRRSTACRSAGVTEQELPVYRRALETLASSGMVVEHSSLVAEQANHA